MNRRWRSTIHHRPHTIEAGTVLKNLRHHQPRREIVFISFVSSRGGCFSRSRRSILVLVDSAQHGGQDLNELNKGRFVPLNTLPLITACYHLEVVIRFAKLEAQLVDFLLCRWLSSRQGRDGDHSDVLTRCMLRIMPCNLDHTTAKLVAEPCSARGSIHGPWTPCGVTPCIQRNQPHQESGHPRFLQFDLYSHGIPTDLAALYQPYGEDVVRLGVDNARVNCRRLERRQQMDSWAN